MKNIYLIYGNNLELIKDKVKSIKDKLNIDQNSIIKYSLAETNLAVILDDASMSNLFGDTKLIIVSDAVIFTGSSDVEFDSKYLEDYLNNSNPHTYLIFTVNAEKLDSRKKIVKLISSKAEVIEANKQEDNLISYCKKYFGDYEINNSDINFLISLVGTNKSNLKNEIDKLILYKMEDKIIAKNDIEDIVNINNEENIFALIEATINRNRKKTLYLYHDLLNKGEEPVKIIALLGSQYRLLYQVKYLNSYDHMKEESIASFLKIHPYRVKLALSSSYRFEEKELLNNLLLLANLDKDIKLGNIEPVLGLELLLMQL